MKFFIDTANLNQIEEAQNLLTVTPPTLFGNPDKNTTFLAKFMPCSASGKAHPKIRSSTSSIFILKI